ncbi:hypothetical protein BTN50_0028 [Candidatus Enterovibrio altilux]|uniref:Mobile element protein n=1 Tax=Candidatus Enterovibrio altilux TaxID=1927128 RepID=A0A291B6E7_9GAMM|nr:hypothetical protein BTN50_0028 [Candidatus Enterovibrio luxaltus]
MACHGSGVAHYSLLYIFALNLFEALLLNGSSDSQSQHDSVLGNRF